MPASGDEVLVENADGTIVRRDDGAIVCACEGRDLQLAMRAVSTFAFVVASVVSALVLTKMIPALLMTIPIVWLTVAGVAFELARRRRRRLGVFVFDASSLVLTQSHGRKVIGSWKFEAIRLVTVERGEGTTDTELGDVDGHARRWIIVDVGAERTLRLGRVLAWEQRKVLGAVEEVGVRVGR